MKPTLAVYIPAYNAEKTILKVLSRIPPEVKSEAKEIILVDNCSSDRTSDVAIEYCQKNGINNLKVFRNTENRGYGGSQKQAYQYCIDQGYDAVVMLHGDAQYAPEHVLNVCQPVLDQRSDMIFGSRIRGNPLKGGMPIHRFLGNRVLTTFQNFFLGLRLSEYHSGYRAYSVAALRQLPFQKLSSDYHFDTEIIILLAHFGMKINEVPIPTHYGDEENYVNIWKYGLDVLVTTFSYWLHKTGIRASQNWKRILGETAAKKILT